MNRETNRSIISHREELRSLYNKWAHGKKSGAEHLPREPDDDVIERIRLLLNEELIKLQAIIECCNELVKEIGSSEIMKNENQK